ncbi:hypothetical protein OG21DRAFT_1216236 [Imleria badia]|nr:hypothetical protein OG21DRAFT_1216236 [Imleria badia]
MQDCGGGLLLMLRRGTCFVDSVIDKNVDSAAAGPVPCAYMPPGRTSQGLLTAPYYPPRYKYHGDDCPFELLLTSPTVQSSSLCTRPSVSTSTILILLLSWGGQRRTRLVVPVSARTSVFTMAFWHRFCRLRSIERALNGRNDTYTSYDHLISVSTTSGKRGCVGWRIHLNSETSWRGKIKNE